VKTGNRNGLTETNVFNFCLPRKEPKKDYALLFLASSGRTTQNRCQSFAKLVENFQNFLVSNSAEMERMFEFKTGMFLSDTFLRPLSLNLRR